MPKTKNLFSELPCTQEGCSALQVAKGLCRLHYQQAHRAIKATNACIDCGVAILPEYQRCRSCFHTSRNNRVCIDCGVALSHRSHKEAQRCWSCWSKFRNTHGPTCIRPECDRPHFGKGLCQMHYLSERAKTKRIGQSRNIKKWVASQPCQLCDYSLMPSEVARIIPGSEGGKYELGNIMALCARCHREVDAGITPMPGPIQFT